MDSTTIRRYMPNSVFSSNLCKGGSNDAITTWETFKPHTANSFDFRIKYSCSIGLFGGELPWLLIF